MAEDPFKEYCRNGFQPTNASMKLKRPRAPFTKKHWCPWIRIPSQEGGYLYPPYDYKPVKPGYSASFITKIKHSLSKAGFYHQYIIRKTWNHIWKTIVNQSGNPPLPIKSNTENNIEVEHIEPEILVIGGGKAGVTIANTLSSLLEKEILLIEEEKIGGHARYMEKIVVNKEIIVMEDTSYLGFFDDGYLALSRTKNKLYKITPKIIVFATGARDALPVFENNDLPGIISSELALEMQYKYQCLERKRIAVVGDGDWAKKIADSLSQKNNVILLTREHDGKKESNYEVLEGIKTLKAKGYPRIQKISIITPNGKKEIEIDFLVVATARHPAIEPLLQHDLHPSYTATLNTITVESLPGGRTRIENVFVIGEVSGTPITLIEKEAEASAYVIASDIRSRPPDPKKYGIAKEIYAEKRLVPINKAIVKEKPSFWYDKRVNGLQFLCPCEDITLEDIVHTWNQGFDKLEKIKRYTALGTGPCQGKLCHITTILLLSYLTEKTIGEIGVFRQRPPLEPVEFTYLKSMEE